MSEPVLHQRATHGHPCVSLIGMAGAGKSTVGRALAGLLGWAHLDTDRLMESYFGAPLQTLFDAFGRQRFVQAEERLVADLGLRRCVISTGGSVIYGPRAVERLRSLGPVVFLEADLETVRSRIGCAEGRGLVLSPCRTLDELYAQRRPLYREAAHHVLATDGRDPEQCARALQQWLEELE
jgi:shikimate kinase